MTVRLPERVRAFVRVVAAEPPHHPEPHPDEPFAPVYDHRPLTAADYGGERALRSPRWPDPIVFGPPGGDQAPFRNPPYAGPVQACGCGAGWSGYEAKCWNCGT